MTLEIRSRINKLNAKRRTLYTRLQRVEEQINKTTGKIARTRSTKNKRDLNNRLKDYVKSKTDLERHINDIDVELKRLFGLLTTREIDLDRLEQETRKLFDVTDTIIRLNKIKSKLNSLIKKKATSVPETVLNIINELDISYIDAGIEHVIARVNEFSENFKYDEDELTKLLSRREIAINTLFRQGRARSLDFFYKLAEDPVFQNELFNERTIVSTLKETTNKHILEWRRTLIDNNKHVDIGSTISFSGYNIVAFQKLDEDTYSYGIEQLADFFYEDINGESTRTRQGMLYAIKVVKYAILVMMRVYLLRKYTTLGVEVPAITKLLKHNNINANTFRDSMVSYYFDYVTYMVVHTDTVNQLEKQKKDLETQKKILERKAETFLGRIPDDLLNEIEKLDEDIKATINGLNKLKQRVFAEIIHLREVKLENSKHMYYTTDPFGMVSMLASMIKNNKESVLYGVIDHGVDVDRWQIVIPNPKTAGDFSSTADKLDYNGYSLQNVYSEDDNCLIATILCPPGLSYIQSKTFYWDIKAKGHIKAIRERLGILSGRIPIRQAKMIAEYGRENNLISHIIAVVVIEGGKSRFVLKEEGFRKNGKGCRGLMFHDNHVSPIISWAKVNIVATTTKKVDTMIDGYCKDDSPPESKTDKPKYFLVFDFETYFHPLTFIVPYSYCAILYNEKEEEVERFFKTNTMGVMPQFFNMLELVNSKYGGDKGTLTILGFNNAGFDNFLIMKNIGLIQQVNPLKSLLIANNRILTMNIFGAKVIDLARFLPPTNLRDVAKAFKTDTAKGEFDHHQIQLLAERAIQAIEEGIDDADVCVFDDWIKENKAKLMEYNVADVKATAQVFFKLRKAVRKVTNTRLESTITISALCYTYWKNINGYSDNDLKAMNLCDGVDISDKVIRKAIVAGRTEVNVGGESDSKFEIHGRFRMKDAKSLYPYAMKDNLYPVGKPKIIEITSLPEDKHLDFGVYQVTVKQKKGVCNIIPDLRHRYEDYKYHDGETRAREDSYDWKSKAEMRSIWLNHIDIQQLIKYHGEDAVKFEGPAYVWTKTAKVFHSYVDSLYKLKQDQDVFKERDDPRYNPALREAAKLMLNSLSGKMLQRNFNRDTKLINRGDEKKLTAFLRTHTNCEIQQIGTQQLVSGDDEFKVNKFPQIIGIYIYAYARKHMYDSIFSKYRARYTDTDSALLMEPEYLHFVANYPWQQTDERQLLGSFSDDSPWGDYAIILAAKSYFLRFENGGYKACLKGVRKGSYWTTTDLSKLTQEEIRDIIHNPNNGLKCYNIGNRDDDELLYKTLFSGTPVYFPSFQMVKTIKAVDVEGQELQELIFDIKPYYGIKCLQF